MAPVEGMESPSLPKRWGWCVIHLFPRDVFRLQMYDKQRYSPNIHFTFFILFVNKTELYIELYIGKVAL